MLEEARLKKLQEDMRKQCEELDRNLNDKKKWTKNEHCIHNKKSERDDS